MSKNPHRSRRARFIVLTASVGTIAGLMFLPTSSASATPADHKPEPGSVTAHVAPPPGETIPRPDGFAADSAPGAVARAFALQSESLKVPGDVTVESTASSINGGRVVRLQQTASGTPILGAEVVIDLDRNNNIRAANSESMRGPVPADSVRVSAQEAEATAVLATAKASGVDQSTLQAAPAAQWIYDPRIIGAPGIEQSSQVWRTEVTDPGVNVRRLVLVDADTGAVAFSLDLIQQALNRRVCDANNTATQVPCTAPVRVEGGPVNAVVDVNNAYDYSGDTYNLYMNNFGRDSLDNHGMTLNSTVRECPTGEACPWQNAQWNGSQMLYGAGFASADDVVGHELTHGVTSYSSDLFYYHQSGAINESLSDIFGEYVDLTNGKGTDTAGVRWKMGEDLTIGAIRDMANPGLFGDPDRTGSANYFNGQADAGGVHTNSGVSNKFASLITDGGTFNGRVVSGLGIPKSEQIIYRASQLLTSATDFKGLGAALRQSCTALIGTAGITAGDCSQVDNAILATEMDTTPPSAPLVQAPVCPTGTTAQDLYASRFENLTTSNAVWARNAIGDYRFIFTQEQFGIRYATSGKNNVWAPQLNGVSDLRMQLRKGWNIPATGRVFLRFNHAYDFEFESGGNYDGGVLEYSLDTNPKWLDAKPLIVNGGYTGTIFTGYGNPLGGRQGFAKVSRGYTSTRLELTTLHGQSVKFRFRTATDSSVGSYGWFIDDVKLYRCA